MNRKLFGVSHESHLTPTFALLIFRNRIIILLHALIIVLFCLQSLTCSSAPPTTNRLVSVFIFSRISCHKRSFTSKKRMQTRNVMSFRRISFHASRIQKDKRKLIRARLLCTTFILVSVTGLLLLFSKIFSTYR